MAIADIRDRAQAAIESVRASPIVERIRDYRYDPPPLGWKAVLVIVGLIVGAYLWGWWGTASARDHWWREQIASRSTSVRVIIEQGRAEIDALDTEILNALGTTDEKLSAAERELVRSRQTVTDDGCPRVPGVCMR